MPDGHRLVAASADDQSRFHAVRSIFQNTNLKKCIGVQMRTGGSLANTREIHQFLTEDLVIRYAKEINNQYTNNEPIYLSTDSDKVIEIVKMQMTNHTVITTDLFPISHSSLSGSEIIKSKCLEF